jgi:hypothetical protein
MHSTPSPAALPPAAAAPSFGGASKPPDHGKVTFETNPIPAPESPGRHPIFPSKPLLNPQ